MDPLRGSTPGEEQLIIRRNISLVFICSKLVALICSFSLNFKERAEFYLILFVFMPLDLRNPKAMLTRIQTPGND